MTILEKFKETVLNMNADELSKNFCNPYLIRNIMNITLCEEVGKEECKLDNCNKCVYKIFKEKNYFNTFKEKIKNITIEEMITITDLDCDIIGRIIGLNIGCNECLNSDDINYPDCFKTFCNTEYNLFAKHTKNKK